MSRVSHFQRFSQRENHVTNNTLLLLRYFYQSSPFKLESVLTALLDTELSIGLSFEQQIKKEKSTPDALITQKPLRIFFETKRGTTLDSDQMRRHLITIADTGRVDNSILIGLTTEPIAEQERKALQSEAVKQGVIFAAVTFTQVVETLRAQCAEFERELLSMVDDYENYLAEEELLEQRNQFLVVFPCGTSIAENVQFDLYYEPSSRSSKRNYRYIGLYNLKTVAYVGSVEAIAVASYQNGKIEFVEESGRLTAEHKQRIIRAVKETGYYDLKTNSHRFYLVDSFAETDSRKVSPYGIWGLRYLDLSKVISAFKPRQKYTTQQLAEALKGTNWE